MTSIGDKYIEVLIKLSQQTHHGPHGIQVTTSGVHKDIYSTFNVRFFKDSIKRLFHATVEVCREARRATSIAVESKDYNTSSSASKFLYSLYQILAALKRSVLRLRVLYRSCHLE